MQSSQSGSGWGVERPPRIAQTAVISIPGEIVEPLLRGRPSRDVLRWVDDVASALDTLSHGVALRSSDQVLSAEAGRALALALARVLRGGLVRRGAPESLAVEVDAEQSAQVADGRRHRTLLPHHDGGNASFLTPSVFDDPAFTPSERRTWPRVVATTRRHKMYQGFFLRSTGDSASITTYYDLLAVLRAAYHHQTKVSFVSNSELARWTGSNVRRALSLIASLGGTYVTLAGMLASPSPSHVVTAVHVAEASFSREDVSRFPDLELFNQSGHAELSPVERLFDRVLREAMGEGWLSFRERFEVGVEGVANDLIMGHNLTLLHGGWRGGRGRVIEPICFVVDDPSGDAYEAWLWQAWRRTSGCGEATVTRLSEGSQTRAIR